MIGYSVIHGARGIRTLNEHRFQIFQKAYGPKALSAKPLQKRKGITANSIPPCEVELDQNLLRAAFVSQMWSNAHESQVKQYPTQANGWEQTEHGYQPIWYVGPQMTDSLLPQRLDDGELDDDDDLAVSSDDESKLSGNE